MGTYVHEPSFWLTIKTDYRLNREIIDRLAIPAGLRELLIGHGFTVEQLLDMNATDITEALVIDVDVGVISKALRQLLNNQNPSFNIEDSIPTRLS